MQPADDTIVAIATPPGRSAIGVVRLSGPSAPALAVGILPDVVKLAPRRATVCRVRVTGLAAQTTMEDEAVVVWFPAPRSYTGEHVVEISAHGNPVLLEGIVRSAVSEGARLAKPGEFTFRAFLHGKRSLDQAEAIADLIEATTLGQARLAFDELHGTRTSQLLEIDRNLFDLISRLEASLDFPEEGYHFLEEGDALRVFAGLRASLSSLQEELGRARLMRIGATVAVVGRPNVGKSSLFNALVGNARAIVTPIAGTTRDLLTERIELGGWDATLVDTAGLRESADPVEREGVSRSRRAVESADLVLLVADATAGLTAEESELAGRITPPDRLLVVWNKCDLVPCPAPDAVAVSALTGAGVGTLQAALAERFSAVAGRRESSGLTDARHIGLIDRVSECLSRAESLVRDGAPEEIVLKELHAAREHLDELTGTRTSDDVLNRVFERFCIGK